MTAWDEMIENPYAYWLKCETLKGRIGGPRLKPGLLPSQCPFFGCLADGAHNHLACPDCGAVRYGNIFCPTCQQRHGMDPIHATERGE